VFSDDNTFKDGRVIPPADMECVENFFGTVGHESGINKIGFLRRIALTNT